MIELPWPSASLSGHNRRRRFSEADVARLRSDYRLAVESGGLAKLASEMGRSVSVLCEKARTLGLTDSAKARRAASMASAAATAGIPKWSDKPHPRGFAGHAHSASAKKKSREASNRFWSSLSPEQHERRVEANLKAAIAKNGRIGPIASTRATTWKAGWRIIGGVRKYYRSRWEANYARYLNWLQHRGDILDWKHEPETFWFEGIRRGVRSYLPDFRVWELDGTTQLHEVKGWEDARSRTILRRMAKYHPDETIVVIRQKQYSEISRRLGALIEGWE